MRLGALLGLVVACGPAGRSSSGGGGGGGGGGDAPSCIDSIDLVFVIDVSGSMGFVLDQLGQQIGRVVTATTALAPDPHFGLIAYVDNDRLDLTGDLEGGKVHLGTASLQTAFSFYENHDTVPNRNPGDDQNTGPAPQNPLCEENALDALYDAATAFPWRDNATRVVIVATDDTFLNAPENYGDRDGDGLITHTSASDYPYTEGNYPAKHNLADTVAMLQAQKIRVFSFTADGTQETCGRGNSPLWGFSRFPAQDIPNGWSKPYFGQQAIPDATGGKDYSLHAVHDGTLSLADTINEAVLGSHCNIIF